MTTPYETLLVNNPFHSHCASDPWRECQPSVDSINSGALNRVMQLIAEKTEKPHSPLAAIVFGESGMGKTYLLKRILDSMRSEKTESSFVFIRSIYNPKTAMRRLLSEMMIDLDKRLSLDSPFTQLDLLIAQVIRDYLRFRFDQKEVEKKQNESFIKKMEQDPLHVLRANSNEQTLRIIRNQAQKYLKYYIGELNRKFLHVVFQYREPSKKTVVIDWLRGELLEPNDCEKLDVPLRETDDMAREEEAREIIISFGLLLERYNRSMLICFDQLDAVRERDQILAFGDMIHFLVNDTAAMLPIAFLKEVTWEERFLPTLDLAVKERLLMHAISLQGCTVEQAKELVEKRIFQTFAKQAKPLSGWLLEALAPKLKFGFSPRQVISLANQTILDGQSNHPKISNRTVKQSMPLEEQLKQEFQEEYNTIIRDLESYKPDAERLLNALRLYLEHRFAFEQEPENPENILTGKAVTAEGKKISCAFFFNTTGNGISVCASLRNAIKFMEENSGANCFYISDSRCKFLSSWKKALENKDSFEKKGGNVMQLDQETVAKWFALLFLADKVKAGDVTHAGVENIEAVNESQLTNFVRENTPFEMLDPFRKNRVKAPVSVPNEEHEVLSFAPTNDTPTNDVDDEAKQKLQELIKTLEDFKVTVSPHEPDAFLCGPRLIRLKVVPDSSQGITVNKIENKAADLKVAMRLAELPLIKAQPGYVSVDVLRRKSEDLTLGEMLRSENFNRKPDWTATFPLGAGIDGHIFWVNLADPTMPSMLIGGTSGSGKSVLLQSIIVGLALSSTRGSVLFTLIDPKLVTFTEYRELPCLRGGDIITDVDLAMQSLGELVEEMDKRYQAFADLKVYDLDGYNREVDRPLPRHVVLIDEYADMLANKKMTEQLEHYIQRLGQKGRASGIHLILATQRPDAKVVTGLIKANLQLKVALKVTSKVNSNIILDEQGAECLAGKGDMLVGGSIPLLRLQGGIVTLEDLSKLIDC